MSPYVPPFIATDEIKFLGNVWSCSVLMEKSGKSVRYRPGARMCLKTPKTAVFRPTIFVWYLFPLWKFSMGWKLVKIMKMSRTTYISKGIDISWKMSDQRPIKVEDFVWNENRNKSAVFRPILKSFGMQVGINKNYHRPNFQTNMSITAGTTCTWVIFTVNL